MDLFLKILLWVAVGAAAMTCGSFLLVSSVIFVKVFVRTSKNKWGRACSLVDDSEQVRMHAEGEAWGEKYSAVKSDVSVVSDGFRLAAEYYDFGFGRTVIIIPGRMEACHYSLFFAEPYRAAGWNVLAIDNRSHGLSEGRYNCLGFREYRDILAWGKLLHDSLGNEAVICHGLCIGSATALYALVSDGCPDYMRGLVADGMYIHFGETFKNHLIERKKPINPYYGIVMFFESLFAGKNPAKYGPIDCIAKLGRPILFIYSKQDIYSLPENGMKLYDTCRSDKEIAWFDKGRHSCVRVNAPERYDAVITEFLLSRFGKPNE